MTNKKMEKIENYVISKLIKKDVRLYDSNILIEMRKLSDAEIEKLLSEQQLKGF